jgi:hypothetical protein
MQRVPQLARRHALRALAALALEDMHDLADPRFPAHRALAWAFLLGAVYVFVKTADRRGQGALGVAHDAPNFVAFSSADPLVSDVIGDACAAACSDEHDFTPWNNNDCGVCSGYGSSWAHGTSVS